MTEPLALFDRHGDRFEPTGLTMGPWRPDAQHGGPPSALLTFLAEELVDPDELIARIRVELRSSVPLSTLRSSTERTAISRRVAHVVTELWSGERLVARAETTVMKRGNHPAPPIDTSIPAPALPGADARVLPPLWASGDDGTPYHRHALEHRPLVGGFSEAGPARQWARLTVPVVAGTEPSGHQRVMACTDIGSGISAVYLPESRYGLINSDLDVMFVGEPSGVWFLLDARTFVSTTGEAGALTTISDERCVVAIATQALLGTSF